jgi:hypothetical protein
MELTSVNYCVNIRWGIIEPPRYANMTSGQKLSPIPSAKEPGLANPAKHPLRKRATRSIPARVLVEGWLTVAHATRSRYSASSCHSPLVTHGFGSKSASPRLEMPVSSYHFNRISNSNRRKTTYFRSRPTRAGIPAVPNEAEGSGVEGPGRAAKVGVPKWHTTTPQAKRHAVVFTAEWSQTVGLLLRGGLVGVLLLEAFDASGRIDHLALPGEKRMASRTDFHAQHRALVRGPRVEHTAAGAVNFHCVIIRMDSFFHDGSSCRPVCALCVLSLHIRCVHSRVARPASSPLFYFIRGFRPRTLDARVAGFDDSNPAMKKSALVGDSISSERTAARLEVDFV